MWGESQDTTGTGDAPGGSSKGGFMDSTFKAPGASSDGRPGANGKGNCLMPTWIGTILDTPLNSLQECAGVNVMFIVVYGFIEKIEESTTKMTVQLRDETATIPVICFVDSDVPKDESSSGNKQRRPGKVPEHLEEGLPVLVYGRPREGNDGNKYILNICMRAVGNNYAKVLNHYMKVKMVEDRVFADERKDDSAEMDASEYEKEPADVGLNLTADQQQVFDLVKKSNNTVHGVSRDEIKRGVPASLVPKVDDILDFFISEGHIYTTITEDQFKST